MLWLFIHFPNLALEAQFLADQRPIPQLLLKPGNQTILQCNDLALQQGVRVGMNKKTAFCLLEACAIADYDSLAEQECLKQLALLCYHQAAQISLVEPDGLLLELGSMLPLFNGLDDYWNNLRQRLKKSGYQFTPCTGHTPQAARILAQAKIELCSDDADVISQTLLQLSVAQLDLPEKVVKKLTSMGIHNYGQLKNTPRKELGYRFGKDMVEHLQKLETDSQPPTSFQLPERFQQTVHLNYEAEQARGLVFPLRRMLLNLEAYLITRQRVCEKLLIKLEHRDGRASVLTIPSVRGSFRQTDWLTLLNIQLENTQLIDPVVSLTLRAKGFLPMQAEYTDLVGGRHQQADADRMHSMLLARLGESHVQTLRSEADPRPEVASQVRNSHDHETQQFTRRWPSFLLPQAKPIRVSDYKIILGPERIEGGWWDAPSIRRDYYIAQRNQQTVWLYRRDDGQWFLHGLFA
jgi:protein ImuB